MNEQYAICLSNKWGIFYRVVHFVTRVDSILEETVGIIWIFTRIFRHIVQDSKFEKSVKYL